MHRPRRGQARMRAVVFLVAPTAACYIEHRRRKGMTPMIFEPPELAAPVSRTDQAVFPADEEGRPGFGFPWTYRSLKSRWRAPLDPVCVLSVGGRFS